MSKYLGLIIMIFILGCKEPKPQNNSLNPLVKPLKDLKSEEEIKRQRMEIVEIGNETPIGNLLDKDSMLISTNDFKGKLLIIDFWATWCSPCLEETPIFKSLETKYETEQVEFITISIDNEFSYWREFISENKWETDNLWLGMKETDPFFSYMYSEIEIENGNAVLIAVPKYVIISPKGKILNNQAPKPSKPEFEKELIELIKEHAS